LYNTSKSTHDMFRHYSLYSDMATFIRDRDYSAKVNTHFTPLGFASGILTIDFSRSLMSLMISYMTVHNYWHNGTPFL